MHQAAHSISQAPGLIVATILCLLVVFAIGMSYRAERKRNRIWRKHIERARLHRPALATATAPARSQPPPQSSTNTIARSIETDATLNGFLLRCCRRPIVWLATLAGTAILILLQNLQAEPSVQARTAPDERAGTAQLQITPADVAAGVVTNDAAQLWRARAAAPTQSSTKTFGTNHAQLWGTDGGPAAQIDISAPSTPIVVPKAPSRPAFGIVKTIRHTIPEAPTDLLKE